MYIWLRLVQEKAVHERNWMGKKHNCEWKGGSKRAIETFRFYRFFFESKKCFLKEEKKSFATKMAKNFFLCGVFVKELSFYSSSVAFLVVLSAKIIFFLVFRLVDP